ncbi:MAG: phosphoribosyl-AMP cyclohydrolase [Verrucomicrobiota bacterium]|nr:phosphoribosyl-AMP cyclohydrolase [Verrucomicrobiota bacterium]
MSHKELEEGATVQLDFTKLRKVANCGHDVLPVVVQHAGTGEVLILAYANQLALETALREKRAVFWSTSRNELWIKGATSGDTLELVEVRVNCEQNSLLYRVLPQGQGACHTKGADGRARNSCYYRAITAESGGNWQLAVVK